MFVCKSVQWFSIFTMSNIGSSIFKYMGISRVADNCVCPNALFVQLFIIKIVDFGQYYNVLLCMVFKLFQLFKKSCENNSAFGLTQLSEILEIPIYNSTARVFVTELLLNGWTDLNKFFCMRFGGGLDGLDLQFGPIAQRSVEPSIQNNPLFQDNVCRVS